MGDLKSQISSLEKEIVTDTLVEGGVIVHTQVVEGTTLLITSVSGICQL